MGWKLDHCWLINWPSTASCPMLKINNDDYLEVTGESGTEYQIEVQFMWAVAWMSWMDTLLTAAS